MDILDIDEALKDDSYIFLADKTHDDVSNILQQWKSNNQTQQLQLHPQLPYNNEAYKHNSKTFTRPKRRNLDFSQNGAGMDTGSGAGTPSGMLQLEIGGLVTTNMHKSFLQDTSPPSSICSSMNTERMNNSLITSADFTNLNFLQSTIGLEQEPSLTTTLTNNQTADNNIGGYTLSDMIRDRKALESLTMCEDDGTLIKDSHIGQIDEISLTLSKTASGCSTMDNSTDSMSNPLAAADRSMPVVLPPAVCPALQRTLILSEEMIGDTTFNLVDSLTASILPSDADRSLPVDGNATFKRPAAAADETQLLTARQMNTTYTEGCNTPEARCETPENVDRKLPLLTMESTPLTTNLRSHFHPNNNNNNNNKPGYTPTLKGHVDMNLSPIVGTTPQKAMQGLGRQQHNNTFELAAKAGAGPSAAAPFNGEKFVLDTMELLEQIEQPLDGTYSLQMSEQHKQMQCVMDLAEAEVEMLAQQGDEEQFEHMLAELGKVNTMSEHQLKMQKSLQTIRRRFHREEPTEADEGERESIREEQHQLSPAEKVETPSLEQSHSSKSNNSSSSGGERLLSRRSRLYDDVNLSAMHGSNASTASCNSTSFIVQRREAPVPEPQPDPEPAEEPPKSEIDPASYKLAERRERDRERFKTIKISKEMRLQSEIIVPCIDDELQQQQPEEEHHQQFEEEVQQEQEQVEPPQRQGSPPGRLSRRDQNSALNNNKAESSASNYLTYKKPKEKSLLQRRPMLQPEATAEAAPAPTISQPRSLSRPRYISGLQKFTTVSKATSAGAGLNSTPAGAMPITVAAPTQASGSGELKSPMGIKSKSFHNLSSTLSGIGTGAAAGAGALPRPSLGGGLRRPGAQPSKLMSGLRGPTQPQEDDSVFKVPKLVSGLRAPGLAGAKRVGTNGLARPSSGYYSLSVKAAPEAETPESLSSASSRGSLYGHNKDNTSRSTANGGNVPPQPSLDTQALTSKLTQVTTGATGIPKPSGLRPPSQMKRSGLPRPSSIVRR